MDSRELRAKRKALIDEQRRIMQPALDEQRGFTSEETEKLARIDKDVEALEATIARVERQAEVERAERAHVPESQIETAATGPTAEQQRAAQYRDGFWGYIRGRITPQELRAMSVGADTAGGYTVPDEFRRELISGLDEANVMRELATVITSSSGTLTLPVLTQHAAASWVQEGAAYNETTPQLDELTFSAHKATALLKVSEELLNDSAFPLETWIAGEFARALAEIEEIAFVVGTGSNQPTGVIKGASAGKTADATNAVTADELMDTYHSLKRPYRRNARWLMHDSTVKAIRKLVTGVAGDKTYLWQPGLQAGEPDTLLGRPVVTSPDVPEIAASAKVIAFGDFRYYYIVDRQQISVQRLNELYSGNGQVGFRIFRRTDGKVVLAEAIKLLTMHS